MNGRNFEFITTLVTFVNIILSTKITLILSKYTVLNINKKVSTIFLKYTIK